MNGADVLVESEPKARCRGFRGVAVPQPVRMLVRSGTSRATAIADQLADGLGVAVGGLGEELAEGELPCGADLRTPCLAQDEAGTRNVLVWVAADDDPDASQHAGAAAWLGASAAASTVAVVPEGRNPDDALPRTLRDRQIVWWNGDRERAAQDVLAAAGVANPERRIFVSYSHSDGMELANAVFHSLSEARFSVFLDALALAPGSDFAERIEHELQRTAAADRGTGSARVELDRV